MRKILILILLSGFIAACSDDASKQSSVNSVKKTKSRKMNISCFVYRDINRNGIYDLGDRPYAGLRFRLTGEEDTDEIIRSNISGFTNFAMSANNPERPISVPGEYRIEAKVPDGWEITSRNHSQTLNIIALEGSPGGLVASKTLEHVGIAPILTLAGTLANELADGASTLKLESSEGRTKPVTVEIDESGGFFVPISEGSWRLSVNTAGETRTREFSVGNYAVRLSKIQPQQHEIDASAGMSILEFEDLTSSDTLYEIPSGYGGLQWYNWIATHQKLYRGAGYINATTSGEFAAYNSSGHPATFESEKPFDFLSVNIGVAWPSAERGNITISGWRDGEMVYLDAFRATTAGPIDFKAAYYGVNKVEISTEQFWQVVIDDLVIAQ